MWQDSTSALRLPRIVVSHQANLDYSQRHRKTFIRNWNTTYLHPLLAPIHRTVRYARDKMCMKGVKGSFVICFQFPYTNIHHVAAVWRQVISFQLKHESSLFVSFFFSSKPLQPLLTSTLRPWTLLVQCPVSRVLGRHLSTQSVPRPNSPHYRCMKARWRHSWMVCCLVIVMRFARCSRLRLKKAWGFFKEKPSEYLQQAVKNIWMSLR